MMFCFRSLSQFRQWFRGKHRRNLHSADYRLALYWVDDGNVFHGMSQSVFNREHAKRIGWLDVRVGLEGWVRVLVG